MHGLLIAEISLIAEHGLNSCGTWAWLLHGMWDFPGPGIEPVSPALAGRWIPNHCPPGKSTFHLSLENTLGGHILLYFLIQIMEVNIPMTS